MFRSILATLLLATPLIAAEPIRLANHPALSPDGKTLVFDWNGDIWSVPSTGGNAHPLTAHPKRDSQPAFSTDGKQLAFVSDREGSPQLYTMSAEGGSPRQITFHTAGYSLPQWLADGQIVASVPRDHSWYRKQLERLVRLDPNTRRADELLFDDYALQAQLSPDGKQVLFVREGVEWWRKGYTGSQAAQIWLYDIQKKTFEIILNESAGTSWPLWKPDAKGFYFTGCSSGTCNLHEYDFASKKSRPLTHFGDDSVVYPCISRDGSTIVFRHLFDLYRLDLANPTEPLKLDIRRQDDRPSPTMDRKVLTTAREAAFTADGLEMALIIGGDLYIMDTELKEPRRLTTTAAEEREPIFSPDGQSLYFFSDSGNHCPVMRARRENPAMPWFRNSKFIIEPLTTDDEAKANLSISPDGTHLAFSRGRGDLWITDLDGKNGKPFLSNWSVPTYDWSPDGKYLAYATYDENSNRDIWIAPIDGSRPPYNVSRHPYNDSDPVWSPDGKILAFIGTRESKETTDIMFVYLKADDDERNPRDRALEKAMEKFSPRPKTTIKDDEPGPTPRAADPAVEPKVLPKTPAAKLPEVIIDFDNLHRRVRRISIANSNESNLFWSPNGKKLAFTATLEGRPALYTLDPTETAKPLPYGTSAVYSHPRWLKNGNLLGLNAGIPTQFDPILAKQGGPAKPAAPGTPALAPGETAYRFNVFHDTDLHQKNLTAFHFAWRLMRDNFYDAALNKRDWNAIRLKYAPIAESAVDLEMLATTINLMLGELNGSHLGFIPGVLSQTPPRREPGAVEPPSDRQWVESTVHLGLRFVEGYTGIGWKIRDVIPESPADTAKAKLQPGEIILSINGIDLDPMMDATKVLNMPPGKDAILKVRNVKLEDRIVTISPTSFVVIRPLIYRMWVADNARQVEQLSKGKLGYLHIAAMDMTSFHKFEEDLFAAGAGKEGLVIDVRANGGGSTADHLLTALTQPKHAIVVPRGSEVGGYPQDRKIYADWNKPIVVLCDQNSFSNAEIFAHAIKTLKRGKLIGVPTAGGVISTGGAVIMDLGLLRLPFRGWYLPDSGEDMERHGAVPDVELRLMPGEKTDTQLAKGVEVLLSEVAKVPPEKKVRRASER